MKWCIKSKKCHKKYFWSNYLWPTVDYQNVLRAFLISCIFWYASTGLVIPIFIHVFLKTLCQFWNIDTTFSSLALRLDTLNLVLFRKHPSLSHATTPKLLQARIFSIIRIKYTIKSNKLIKFSSLVWAYCTRPMEKWSAHVSYMKWKTWNREEKNEKFLQFFLGIIVVYRNM